VQRIMSLATLAIMGGLGWLFFQGNGLDQIVVSPRGGEQTVSTTPRQPSTAAPIQPLYRAASTATGSVASAEAGDGPTIRIASFNIQIFGNTKASKPYVMDALAQIVRQFDIVAVQEIRSKNKYLIPNFVETINRYGRKFDHIIGPRVGYTSVKEQYVYLFDTDKVQVDRQSIYTVGDPDGLLHREPLVATFRTRGVDPDQAFTFTLINIHTDPDVAAEEVDVLAEVYRVVRRSSRGEDDVILLGDFNVDDRHLGRLGELPGVYPLISGVWTNTRQNKQYDNLVIHQPSTTEYAGRSGVFDFMRVLNLNQSQALQVSDHFPVWAEFSIYERDRAGRVASRRREGDR